MPEPVDILCDMLRRGYFPLRLLDNGQFVHWEHVSWSKKFPGVLPEAIKLIESSRA